MTGSEHFREAESMIRKAQKLKPEPCALALAQAQVHATPSRSLPLLTP